jgi:streptogramin lyase
LGDLHRLDKEGSMRIRRARSGTLVIVATILHAAVLGTSPAGARPRVAELTIPVEFTGPWDITVGPDGSLWFTESDNSAIGRVTLSGEFQRICNPRWR